MEPKVPAYLALVETKFDDKDVDNLIEHFRDPDRRKEFLIARGVLEKPVDGNHGNLHPKSADFVRDHTLLQAIARVNRPYENEEGARRGFTFFRPTRRSAQDQLASAGAKAWLSLNAQCSMLNDAVDGRAISAGPPRLGSIASRPAGLRSASGGQG